MATSNTREILATLHRREALGGELKHADALAQARGVMEARDALASFIEQGTPNALRLQQALRDAVGASNFAVLTQVSP